MVGRIFFHVLRRSLSPTVHEIDALRKEAQAFQLVRAALRSQSSNDDAAKLTFEKV